MHSDNNAHTIGGIGWANNGVHWTKEAGVCFGVVTMITKTTPGPLIGRLRVYIYYYYIAMI